MTVIRKLSQYIDFVKNHKQKMHDSECDGILFFRGNSCKGRPLWPSIMRKSIYLQKEDDMLKELFLRQPNEFERGSNFIKLTKVQHYGLPSRLLDITENPLVALYFACKKNDKNNNAEVDFLVGKPVSFDNRIVQKLSFIAIQPEKIKAELLGAELWENGIIKHEETEYSKYLNDYKQYKYCFVKPPMNNERLTKQNGAFILFGIDSFNDGILEKKAFDIDEIFQQPHCLRLEIAGSAKKTIISELDSIGINESTLFPELEHQAGYIKTKFLGDDAE